MNYTKNVPILHTCDVLVCGGGPAGFPAALQAARLGASTCLIEKSNMLGGIMTTGRNNDIALFYAGDTQIIGGIGWEFVTRLSKLGYAQIPVFASGIRHSQQGVRVNIPMSAWLLDEMCLEDKVHLEYLTTLVDILPAGDGWVAVCSAKGGLFGIEARRVVDATGDGDACVYAGAHFELGDPTSGDLQPGTLGFYLEYDSTATLDEDAIRSNYARSVEQKEMLASDIWPNGATPSLALHSRGINVNHIGIPTDFDRKRTQIEIEGRRSVARLLKWLREHAAGVNPRIEAIAPEVAMRESRRIHCDKDMTVDEYIAGTVFEDAICYSYYPIDLHKHGADTLHNIFLDEKRPPTIPYGMLLPQGVENMLVAGRCMGGDRLSHSAYRIKATCMGAGQAAGAAAALSAQQDITPRLLDTAALRATLREHGAILPA